MKHFIVLAIAVLSVIPVLARQLRDSDQGIADTDPAVRLKAVETLPVTSDTARQLIRTLDDADAFVRAASRDRLRRSSILLSEVLVASKSNASERYWAKNLLLNFLREDAVSRSEAEGIRSDVKNDILKETLDIRCLDGRCLESWVGPVYAPLANSASVEGRVWVSFFIDDSGRPTDVSTKGHPLLVDSAKSSIEQWRFAPGPSRATRTYVVVDFRIIWPSSYTREFVSEMNLVNYVAVFARRPR